MPVILGVSEPNGLIAGTITGVGPAVCTVDGAVTAINVLTGFPYVPVVGDRVGLERIGSQYLAFPIDRVAYDTHVQVNGPGVQTDYTGVATVCTVNMNVINGRRYLVVANIAGTTQVTNAGVPTTKVLVAGAEFGPGSVSRLYSSATYVANTVIAPASFSASFIASSTGVVAISATSQSSAAAHRIPAGNLGIEVLAQ